MPTPTSTPNAATTTRPERSSKRTAHKAPLGWLPWALLGLLALLVAATLLLINAVDDDGPAGPAGDTLGQVNSGGSGIDGKNGDSKIAGTEDGTSEDGAADTAPRGGAAPEGSAAPEASAAPAAGAVAGTAAAASLTANGEDLLAAADGSLARRAGQAVTGTATVESVVSDEGFWVGSSAEKRVFVFLTTEARQSQGESGFQVKAGQTVQLEGAMTALQGSPEVADGVEAAEGADLLRTQAAFISADAVTLA